MPINQLYTGAEIQQLQDYRDAYDTAAHAYAVELQQNTQGHALQGHPNTGSGQTPYQLSFLYSGQPMTSQQFNQWMIDSDLSLANKLQVASQAQITLNDYEQSLRDYYQAAWEAQNPTLVPVLQQQGIDGAVQLAGVQAAAQQAAAEQASKAKIAEGEAATNNTLWLWIVGCAVGVGLVSLAIWLLTRKKKENKS